MQTLFGFDLPTAQKVLIASVVILVLLILLGLFVRQIKGGRLRMKGQGGGRVRQPRLGVVDTHDLDRQRQLILIRRDNVEHLIMIGGASDVVVETNIVRSGARASIPLPSEGQPAERPMALDPTPGLDFTRAEPVEEPRRVSPPAPVAVAVPEHELPLPPPLPPRVAPPPRPGQPQPEITVASVAPAVAVAMGAAYTASQASAPATQAPSFAREHSPAPAASVGELDDMTRQLEEALKRPFSAVRPANAPVVPQEMARPAPVSMEAAETMAPIAMPPPLVAMARPVATPADVEAELELALGLKPERVSPRPPVLPEPVLPPQAFVAPEPAMSEPEPEVPAIVEAEPDTPPAIEEPEAIERELVEMDSLFEPHPSPAEERDPPMHSEESVEVHSEERKPETEAAVEEDKSEDAPPEKPEPAAIDPFSVDAIEAEFARLLGREPKSRP